MKYDLNTLYCRNCGSTRVTTKMWVDPNTMEIDGKVIPADEDENFECNWCCNCMDYTQLATISQLWDDFSEIPVDNDDNIEKDFLIFDKGTSKFDVWHWFDERCPNGIYTDLIQ